MATAATYIDFVVVDRLTTDFEFATRSRDFWRGLGRSLKDAELDIQASRDEWAPDAVRIHYRVLESLKANGPRGFELNGIRDSANAGVTSGPSRARGPVSLEELKFFLDQQDLADWPGVGACEQAIEAVPGQTYLVFRDSEGRLIRARIAIQFGGKTSKLLGPSHIPVTGPRDAWVRLARAAAQSQLGPAHRDVR